MTTEPTSNLDERMEAASCLPEHDPERTATAAAAWAAGRESDWTELVDEVADWRGLLTPAADPHLESALLVAPRSSRSLWQLSGAAILLIVGCTLAYHHFEQKPLRDLESLASLALANHEKTDSMDWVPSDTVTLQQTLSRELGFEVMFPAQGMAIQGGRKCSLDEQPVAWLSLADQGQRSSLFQLRAEDFGLPPHLEPSSVRLTGADGQRYTARLWVDDNRGYALIEPR